MQKPGPTAQVTSRNDFPSAESAKWASIPDVAFIKLDFVCSQKFSVLFLKGKSLVVLFLILDIPLQ
jgi:hypothetical protein